MTPGSIAIVLLFATLIWGLVNLAQIVHDNHTRRRLAENGTPADVIRALFMMPAVELATLRGAVVMISAGAALIVLRFLSLGARDPAAYGVLMLSIGLALLAYQLMLPRVLRALQRLEQDD